MATFQGDPRINGMGKADDCVECKGEESGSSIGTSSKGFSSSPPPIDLGIEMMSSMLGSG